MGGNPIAHALTGPRRPPPRPGRVRSADPAEESGSASQSWGPSGARMIILSVLDLADDRARGDGRADLGAQALDGA